MSRHQGDYPYRLPWQPPSQTWPQPSSSSISIELTFDSSNPAMSRKRYRNRHQPINSNHVAIVIAALNEETGIAKTITSLLKITQPQHIYVTNDGSRDRTEEIAKSYGVNVFTNPTNIGKTRSLKKTIDEGQLLKRYQAVMFIDADTEIDLHFFKHALPTLNRPDIAAVAGRVKTVLVDNPFVIYRAFYYAMWQQFWKRLSNPLNGIIICPGTAGVYKTSYLKYLQFDSQLIIEDFDLTFQLHRGNFGRIIYVPDSIVYTQDPDNLHEYHRQLIRWNLGFLQTALKHRIPSKLQAFEIMASYFFLQNLVHISLLFALPLYILTIISIISLNFSLDSLTALELHITTYFIFDILFLILTIGIYFTKHRYWPALKYLPTFWLIQYVNASAFIHAVWRLFTAQRTSAWVSPARWQPTTLSVTTQAATPSSISLNPSPISPHPLLPTSTSTLD